ncbi:hypothetical protein JXL19_12615 [bacterium]|nr:hypothetical protein [bacterium]
MKILQVIDVTDDTFTFLSNTHMDKGSEIKLEIRLPEKMPIKSLTIKGDLIQCSLFCQNGSSIYLIEIKTCLLSEVNRKILAAYKDYLERDKEIKKLRHDYNIFNEAVIELKENFRHLASAVLLFFNMAKGVLESAGKLPPDKTSIDQSRPNHLTPE